MGGLRNQPAQSVQKKHHSVIELVGGSRIPTFINNSDKPIDLTFDTGASTTWVYEQYFKAHEKDIMEKYRTTQLKLGGAGGLVSHEVYRIKFPIKIGDQSINLDSVILFPNKNENVHGQYSGNLGLDAIKSFDKMILNFEDMFVQFSTN